MKTYYTKKKSVHAIYYRKVTSEEVTTVAFYQGKLFEITIHDYFKSDWGDFSTEKEFLTAFQKATKEINQLFNNLKK